MIEKMKAQAQSGPTPEFEEPALDGDCVIRKGKVKKGFMSIKIKVSYFFDDSGLINRIVSEKL